MAFDVGGHELAARHDFQPLGPHGVERAAHELGAHALPGQSLRTSVWASTIRSPARLYSTKATAPPLAISNRLAAGLSLT